MKDYNSKQMLHTSKGMDITVYDCKPQQFTDDVWQQYIALAQDLAKEHDPDSPPPSSKLLKEMMLDPSQEWEYIRLLAFKSGTNQLIIPLFPINTIKKIKPIASSLLQRVCLMSYFLHISRLLT